MEKILVSACLLGEACKYSGGSNYREEVADFLKRNESRIEAILICPEVMGGLPTPRTPAELCGAFVITKDGRDVTEAYIKGAEAAARSAGKFKCRYAILKERSPSCGSGKVYDGTFTGTLIPGDGRTGELLKQMGVRVYGETEIAEFESAHSTL